LNINVVDVGNIVQKENPTTDEISGLRIVIMYFIVKKMKHGPNSTIIPPRKGPKKSMITNEIMMNIPYL
jgi:hypothetical protein